MICRPLIKAVGSGKVIPIDVLDHREYTPLHYAAKEGIEKNVALLLASNANPNAMGNTGKTPLHRARRDFCTKKPRMG